MGCKKYFKNFSNYYDDDDDDDRPAVMLAYTMLQDKCVVKKRINDCVATINNDK